MKFNVISHRPVFSTFAAKYKKISLLWTHIHRHHQKSNNIIHNDAICSINKLFQCNFIYDIALTLSNYVTFEHQKSTCLSFGLTKNLIFVFNDIHFIELCFFISIFFHHTNKYVWCIVPRFMFIALFFRFFIVFTKKLYALTHTNNTVLVNVFIFRWFASHLLFYWFQWNLFQIHIEESFWCFYWRDCLKMLSSTIC